MQEVPLHSLTDHLARRTDLRYECVNVFCECNSTNKDSHTELCGYVYLFETTSYNHNYMYCY